MKNEKTITLTFDYYGNKDYGKRAFWFEGTNNFVFLCDFYDWAKEVKAEGYKIILTNPEEVNHYVLKAIK